MIGTLIQEHELTGSLSPTLSLQGVLQNNLLLTGELAKLLTITATIEQVDGKISGQLTNLLSIEGSLAIESEISGTLSVPTIPLTEDDYTGEYFVIPLALQQTILDTQYKRMLNDVVIDKIPYYETTNQSDGYTVIIG